MYDAIVKRDNSRLQKRLEGFCNALAYGILHNGYISVQLLLLFGPWSPSPSGARLGNIFSSIIPFISKAECICSATRRLSSRRLSIRG